MSYEIKKNLDGATDEVRNLRSAYDDMNRGYRNSNAFMDLMSTVGEFLADKIDDVYNAMDEAIDEIQRLDDENEELRERIEELEKQVDELEEK